MGAVVSALAFPVPNRTWSQRSLLERESKGQLVYITTKSGHRVPAVHIQRKSSPSVSSSSSGPKSSTLTVLYSHGNAEDVGLSLPYLDYISHFCDCHVFAYEYCGYSIADGEPSETACYECIEAAYVYLTEEQGLSPSQIVLFGRSLGTGPTIDMAAKICKQDNRRRQGQEQDEQQRGQRKQQPRWWRRLAGVVLQSPLESGGRCVLGDVASVVLYPFDIFRSYEKIHYLRSIPVLFMHGMVDRVVPAANGQALYRTWRDVAEPTAHADAKECQPLWIPDAGHNDMPEVQCMQSVSAFLEYLKTIQ